MYKKKTLRQLPPITRRYARILNDLDSVIRRLKNLTEVIDSLEFDSRALHKRQEYESNRSLDHINLDEFMQDQIDEYFNLPEDER